MIRLIGTVIYVNILIMCNMLYLYVTYFIYLDMLMHDDDIHLCCCRVFSSLGSTIASALITKQLITSRGT